MKKKHDNAATIAYLLDACAADSDEALLAERVGKMEEMLANQLKINKQLIQHISTLYERVGKKRKSAIILPERLNS
jgi:hypothetical protein